MEQRTQINDPWDDCLTHSNLQCSPRQDDPQAQSQPQPSSPVYPSDMSSSPPQVQQYPSFLPVSPQSQVPQQQQQQPGVPMYQPTVFTGPGGSIGASGPPSPPAPSGPPPSYGQTVGYQQQPMMSNIENSRAVPVSPADAGQIVPPQGAPTSRSANMYVPPAAQPGWCASGQHLYVVKYGVSVLYSPQDRPQPRSLFLHAALRSPFQTIARCAESCALFCKLLLHSRRLVLRRVIRYAFSVCFPLVLSVFC
jgi:hypothetical protein